MIRFNEFDMGAIAIIQYCSLVKRGVKENVTMALSMILNVLIWIRKGKNYYINIKCSVNQTD